MLYHASSTAGIRTLLPRPSTHGMPYVYAIANRITALCFGAPKDDFDLLMDEIDGKPVLSECYPHALERVYAGRSCALYVVKREGFLSGRTGWDAEWVSEQPTEVVREEAVADIYDMLLQAESRGECVINRFANTEAYRAMLRDELGERIKAMRLSKERMRGDERFQRYFSWLTDERK